VRGVPELVLDVQELQRSFGDLRAVDGVSFQVHAGETYGLLGPNGAGKTTTISMICGLLRPDGGTISILGEAMTASTVELKRQIGYVPQDLAVYPDLTARENLRFFGQVQGIPRASLAERIATVLEIAGLAERADDRVAEYSGGMKRRLNIAIGLIHEPQLLILDEPTVGVDPQSRNQILETVDELSVDGLAVLYTTHYMEEAERLCDRVGIIDQGRLQAEGTRRDLIAQIGDVDRVRLTARGDLHQAVHALERLSEVDQADLVDDETIELMVHGASAHLPAVMGTAASAGLEVTGVQVQEPDLEAVFLQLTGKALRD
jgi:ABC-2 type transport system ATP-binding protein